ncbi:PadR family transcriptional regulator [Enterococcus sp. LJL99]
MSTIDLTLLGILIEKPISAYDLKKEIAYRNLNEWTRISEPIIYKKVNSLAEKGYLDSLVIQNSNYAPKKIYQITASGEEYFQLLMEKYSKQEVKIPIDINTIIANLEKVNSQQAVILIQNMLEQIAHKMSKLNTVAPNREHIPVGGKAIIKQQLDLYTYLNNWLSELQTTYISRSKEDKN